MRPPQTHLSGTETPLRAPVYSEPLLGDDAFLEPQEALHLFCHQVKVQLEISRHWLVGLHSVECFEAVNRNSSLQCRFLAGPERLAVSLSVFLADDWICATVSTEVSSTAFFVERSYEDWEVWPAGSAAEGDSPGSISRRMHWVQLDPAAWPILEKLNASKLVTIEAAS